MRNGCAAALGPRPAPSRDAPAASARDTRACCSPGSMTLSPRSADSGIAAMSLSADLRRELAIARARCARTPRSAIADQVHLVDREHDPADAEQRHQVAVPAGLRQHALARIDQDDGQVGGRGAGHHVARVLLVPGRVGDDELAPLGGEEAVGDVDGDALLALGRQPVDQQREIELLALGAEPARVALERRELIVEQRLRFVQQPADQRALAVIDAAAGDEAQQLLARLWAASQRSMSAGGQPAARRSSEIAFLLLLLHRCGAVVIDDPALALGGAWRRASPR